MTVVGLGWHGPDIFAILFESNKPDLIEQRIKNFFRRRKVTEKRVGCGLRHVAEIMYALCVQLQPTSGFGAEFER